uniref:Uncharacterized protein n=1 Tax=Romanomermis culicivorax TaxID=13658 RepID=A0A915KH54_ROMCU
MMDRSKISHDAQGVAKEAVFKEKQSMIYLVRIRIEFSFSNLFYLQVPRLFIRSRTCVVPLLVMDDKAAIDCHFVSPSPRVPRCLNHHPFLGQSKVLLKLVVTTISKVINMERMYQTWHFIISSIVKGISSHNVLSAKNDAFDKRPSFTNCYVD